MWCISGVRQHHIRSIGLAPVGLFDVLKINSLRSSILYIADSILLQEFLFGWKVCNTERSPPHPTNTHNHARSIPNKPPFHSEVYHYFVGAIPHFVHKRSDKTANWLSNCALSGAQPGAGKQKAWDQTEDSPGARALQGQRRWNRGRVEHQPAPTDPKSGPGQTEAGGGVGAQSGWSGADPWKVSLVFIAWLIAFSLLFLSLLLSISVGVITCI